jgi:hypothetical protein
LKNLDYNPPSNERNLPGGADGKVRTEDTQSWERERTEIYKSNQGIFLAHILTPSDRDPDGYHVYIYLIKHRRNDVSGPHDLSDVVRAELFLGHMWGNRIFEELPKNGLVGMSTSAYAPFLCVCHVHLKDGSVLKLSRYVDFEMGNMVYRRPR